jgi:hypothetical protein
MKTRGVSIVLLAVLALGLVGVAGCEGQATEAPGVADELKGQTVVASPSWAADEVLDMKAMGRRATRVVTGVVESVGPPQAAILVGGFEDGITVVYSDATVLLNGSMKGKSAEESERIAVRLLGGTLSDYTFRYEDEAQMSAGDRVVLFLTDNPDTLYPRDIQSEFDVSPYTIGRPRKVLISPAPVRRTGNPIGATRRLLAC